jgi:hypothetical protein
VDRLFETVDAHIVAEHLARALLASQQRRAGKADEGRVGQRGAHIEGEGVVLAAVRLVGNHDDVRAVGELRVRHAGFGAELLDQGEDVAMVLAQQATQRRGAVGLGLLLGHGADVDEVLVDLIVQLLPIGDDDEGPAAGPLAQHLLREEDHRDALATALRMPEDSQPAAVGVEVAQPVDGAVDAKVLVVLRQPLDQLTLPLVEQDEVLH